MWWLSFRHGGVAVIKASTLVHARLLAARNGLGRASHFTEGYFIDPARTTSIPDEYVGRMLSPIEARQLGELLQPQLRDHVTGRSRESRPSSPRRRG
jgi:hypothetical protein